MHSKQNFGITWVLVTLLTVFFASSTAQAQATSFTYQGRLADSGTPTNGNYDLQFALWNSSSGGGQVGSAQTINSVAVSNGVFTVSLDFGANSFSGASRFLEIAVRPAGVGSFTVLTPRQPITSTPYSVRSLNAATADSVPASGVPSGSGNYIQNTTTPQVLSNFNISGSGTVGGTLSANMVNASTQFNLNGNRVLATGSHNIFVGVGAGLELANVEDSTFIGFGAGKSAQSSSDNTFVGSNAGTSSTSANQNSFFGTLSGFSNTTAGANSFFGYQSGFSNTVGQFNSFFGYQSGDLNISGSNNTFIGYGSGNGSVTLNLSNATAIGSRATVTQSNSLVLGSIKGVAHATEDTNVGIGTTTPSARLSVVAIGDGAKVLHLGTERSWVFKQFGTGASTALELTADDPNNNNKNFLINTQGNVGIGTQGPLDKLHVIGDIRVGVTGTNGCLKNNNGGTIIGTCSSDVRFKRNLLPFGPTLQKLARLQPKYFFWRTAEFPNRNFGPAREAGLIAQEVEQVLPELVSEDAEGFKQVDYSKLPLMLLQAVKEQQSLIQTQQEQIAGLKLLICRTHRRAAVCK